MAYNADAVSKAQCLCEYSNMTVLYAVSSRSLVATPSTVVIQSMHSPYFSMQNREPVCLQEFVFFPKIKPITHEIHDCDMHDRSRSDE